MRIFNSDFPGWLDIDGDFSEQDIIKKIPIRKFDKKTNLWTVPDTKRVRNYLEKFGGIFPPKPDTSMLRRGLPRFKTKPYEHQIHDLELMDGKTAFAILDEPGLGKSKVVIDDSTRLWDSGAIEGVIIVCPNSIKSNWSDQIEIHSPVQADVLPYRSDRKDSATQWVERGPNSETLRFLVMAVESMSSRNATLVSRDFARRHRTLLIIDESTRIKTSTANRTKNVISLSTLCKFKRIMTGTLLTKSLEGAWSQFEALDPRILNMDFYPFRGYFCVLGGYKMKQVVASRNEDDFFDIVSPWISLKKKSECLDLPNKVFQTRKVSPTSEMKKLYNDIVSGVANDPSFSVAMVRDLRLHQISGGFTYKIDTEASMKFLMEELAAIESGGELPDPDKLDTHYISVPVPGPNPKIEELLEIADEIPGKIVVWCRYRAEILAIADSLKSAKYKFVEFHGGVDEDLRQDSVRAFQNDPEVKFFIGQVNTGGIGLTLTSASTMVFFSNDWSGENRIQAEDRIHRISQKGSCCLYIDLVLGDETTPSGGFIDSRVLRAVQQGKDYHAFVQNELQSRQKISCANDETAPY